MMRIRGYLRVVIVFSGLWVLGVGYFWLYPAWQLAPTYTSLTDVESAQTYFYLKQQAEQGMLRREIAEMFRRAEAAGKFRAVQFNYVRVEGTDIVVPFDLTASEAHIHSVMAPIIADYRRQHLIEALEITLIPPFVAGIGLALWAWVHHGFRRSKALR